MAQDFQFMQKNVENGGFVGDNREGLYFMEDFIMALVKCPECGGENVSDSAETCPNCGYPIKKYFQEVKEKQQEEISQKQTARNLIN